MWREEVSFHRPVLVIQREACGALEGSRGPTEPGRTINPHRERCCPTIVRTRMLKATIDA